MSAEPVTVTVGVSGALADALSAKDARERIRAEVIAQLTDLELDLGIQRSATADISARDSAGAAPPSGGSWTPADDIEIRVGGTLCRFPLVTPAYVEAAVDGQLPASTAAPQWLRPAGETGVERLARMVGGVCREAVRLQPSVLIDETWVSDYADSLRACRPEPSAAVTDPGWLTDVLSATLDLGIGVGDKDRVAALLRECDGLTPSQARETLIAGLSQDTIGLFIPDTAAGEVGTGDSAKADDPLTFLGQGMFEETGIVFPPVAVRPTDSRPPLAFAVRVNDIMSLPFPLLGVDECLVNAAPAALRELAPDARPALIPPGSARGAVIPASAADSARRLGYTTWTRGEHVILQLAVIMRNQAASFIHQDRVLAQMEALEADSPALVRLARALYTPDELTALLRRLARDRVPLRDLPFVLERIADLSADDLGVGRYAITSDRPEPKDTFGAGGQGSDRAEAFVRSGLRYQIAQRQGGGQRTIFACLLGQDLESLIRSGAGDEQNEERILRAIRARLSPSASAARPPAIVTTAEIRPVLRRLVASVLPEVTVLAYGDLPAATAVMPVARITLPGLRCVRQVRGDGGERHAQMGSWRKVPVRWHLRRP